MSGERMESRARAARLERFGSGRRAAALAFLCGLALHTVAAFLAWRSYGTLGRGGVLIWIDLPLSLAYLELKGKALLSTSLLVGGLQWGAFAALLTFWLGRSIRDRGTG